MKQVDTVLWKELGPVHRTKAGGKVDFRQATTILANKQQRQQSHVIVSVASLGNKPPSSI